VTYPYAIEIAVDLIAERAAQAASFPWHDGQTTRSSLTAHACRFEL
jgi:hypothetical protein